MCGVGRMGGGKEEVWGAGIDGHDVVLELNFLLEF